MATSSTTKVVRYILVIPSPPSLSLSHLNEGAKNEQNNWQDVKRNDPAWLLATNCNCRSSFFGGLCLAILFVASIVVPFMITLSISKTEVSLTSSITNPAATTTNIPCSSTCNTQQSCIKGVCVGVGYLSCTMTWSRAGDGDIVVTTPNKNNIYYNKRGPSTSTDEGQLDKDDTVGTGPENIFWSNSSSVPPIGVYYVCFEPYNFSPLINSTYPISVTIKVLRSNYTPFTVTKNFTSTITNHYNCSSNSSTLLTSFTYP